MTKTYIDNGGDRLNLILDFINLPEGHGRVKRFHDILASKVEFKNLNYSTVNSWFHNITPSIQKINNILKALDIDLYYGKEINSIVLWWKMGGENPLLDIEEGKSKKLKVIDKSESLKIIVYSMALVKISDESLLYSDLDFICKPAIDYCINQDASMDLGDHKNIVDSIIDKQIKDFFSGEGSSSYEKYQI